MNHFNADLQFGNQASHAAFWDEIYRKAFPDMVGSVVVNQDCPGQRIGIDRVIQLRSGKTLKVDEKKRRGTYSDILLEYMSNDTTRAPGWMAKEGLQIDYLAYAFMPKNTAYLFPWLTLRRVWLHDGARWIRWAKEGSRPDIVQHVVAPNRTYQTLSVAVNTEYLLGRVTEAMKVQLA